MARISKKTLRINKCDGFFLRWELTAQVYLELRATILNVAEILSVKLWIHRMHHVNENNS